jgi:hypothetical protein
MDFDGIVTLVTCCFVTRMGRTRASRSRHHSGPAREDIQKLRGLHQRDLTLRHRRASPNGAVSAVFAT